MPTNDRYDIPQNNSARRRAERNGGTDRPDSAPTQIGAYGGVAPGTHQPFVHVYIGDSAVNLGVTDAVTLGSTIFQAAAMAFEDAMLTDFLQAVLGMDKLQAFQQMSNFQAFRQARLTAHLGAQGAQGGQAGPGPGPQV